MREMKDSGFEWIGKIPKDWIISKLKYELLEPMKYGASETGIDYDEKLYRYIRITDITSDGKLKHEGKLSLSESQAKDYVLLNNTVLFARSGGTVGKAFLYKEEYGKAAFAGYLISAVADNKKMNPKWLIYYTGSSAYMEWINRIFTQATIQNIGADKYSNMQIPIPSLDEQYMIIDYLDTKCAEIDALTADIQTQIDTLEQYKRSVITEAVTKGLNPDVEMKDSGTPWCPLIPIHWKYANPKALFTQRLDRAYPRDKQLTASQEYGVIYQDEYMELTGTKIVTVMKDFSILKHVEPNDFVISMRSFQGGLEYSERRGSISSAYVMLIPNNEYVYPPFYRWFFKSSKYINAIQSTSNLVRDGQAMRYANFAQVPLFIIPLDEQKQISEYLDEKVRKIDEILKSKKSQLEILAEYKKSLIYEYVTGKKEVPAI